MHKGGVNDETSDQPFKIAKIEIVGLFLGKEYAAKNIIEEGRILAW